MNIFVLDSDHTKCAQYHNDRHLNKLILEHAQMLSTNYRLLVGDKRDVKVKKNRVYREDKIKIKNYQVIGPKAGATENDILTIQFDKVRKNFPALDSDNISEDGYLLGYDIYLPGFANHPCTVWARQSYANYKWLVDLTIALETEKIYRTGSGHSSMKTVRKLGKLMEDSYKELPFPKSELTPFAQAMPNDVKHEDGPTAYRQYYKKHKRHLAVWKKRGEPSWWE